MLAFLSSSASTIDDRDTPVALWRFRSASAGETNDAERALAQRIAFLGAAETRRFAIAIGFVPPVVVVTITALGLSWGAALSLMVVLMLCAGALLRGHMLRRVEPVVRKSLLAECRCASCAYDLRGLAAAPDGCTVCPECDAAWSLDPDASELRGVRERLHARPVDPDHTSDDHRFLARVRAVLAGFGFRRHIAALDARGRMVGLLDPGLLGRRPPRWSEVAPRRRRAIRARLWSIGMTWRVLMAVCLLPAAAMNVWAMRRFTPGTLGASPLTVILYGLAAVWMPLMVIAVVLRPFMRSGKPIVDIMLREWHCPSCAASLTSRDDNGAWTCPACRAAWKP
jgi:hypothetical protein